MAETMAVGTTKGLTLLDRENGGSRPRSRVFEGNVITAVAADPLCIVPFCRELLREGSSHRAEGLHTDDHTGIRGAVNACSAGSHAEPLLCIRTGSP
jgi:hypothetical protein